jgi:hypothetical protein
LGVLAQETIARVDRLRAGSDRRLEDAIGSQVAVGSGWAADGYRLIGVAHVQAAAIGFRIDGHGADVQPAQRALNAAGNGAAVRDQDLVEQPVPSRARRAVPANYQELRVVPQSDGKFSPPPGSESVSVSDCRRCRDC